MVAWFLSDLHLDFAQSRWALMNQFVENLFYPGDWVFFLGDVFDLWVGNHVVWYESYRPVAQTLEKIAQLGKVFYFEGNHDFALVNFWRQRNIIVCKQSQLLNLGPFRVWLGHGDDFNPHERWFHRWLKVAKSSYFESLVNLLPSGLVFRVSYFWWDHRRRSRMNHAVTSKEVAELWHQYCVRIIDQSAPDVIVTGHIHERLELAIGGVRCFNLGWWGHEPAALRFDFETFRWDWISL